MLSGDDNLTLPLMAVGGRGVISVVGNFLAREVADMTHAALEGDWKRARELHLQLFPSAGPMFIETNPIPVKEAMAMLGMIRAEWRLPMCRLTQANREKLRGSSGSSLVKAGRRARWRMTRRPSGAESPRGESVELVVAGAAGRMGSAHRRAGPRGRRAARGAAPSSGPAIPPSGGDAGEVAGAGRLGVPIGADAGPLLARRRVLVEFSVPEPSLEHLRRVAAGRGAARSIGTTGLSAAQREEIAALAARAPIMLVAQHERRR